MIMMTRNTIFLLLFVGVSLIGMAAAQTVVPDLGKRLARWQQVKMPFDASALNATERQMVDKLVEASQYLDSAYWRQSDPEGLALYKKLGRDPQDAKLRRFLMINGSCFDLLDENRSSAKSLCRPVTLYTRRV